MATLETVAWWLVVGVVAAVPVAVLMLLSATLGVRWNERNALVWLSRWLACHLGHRWRWTRHSTYKGGYTWCPQRRREP